ncbi:MAG: hypothetical protein IKK82_03150 [Kiritimatiellae bacterium]|nr:hypothetical protein [Kiritimatiellia bacterium]
MALVESVPIAGLSVYGIQQKDYTVEGVANCDYVKAASIAMFQEANAIEAETSSYAAVLKARQKKLDELGWALAVIVKAVASLTTNKPESDDKSAADVDLKTASQILDKYRRDTNADMKLPVDGDFKVRRDDATMAQSALQYEIDYETNEMQQDMVTMQSLVSKRDNAFSTAASLVQKINSTASTLIGNMG